MDDKDKLIKELNQKIYSLESRVEYLQGILSGAKISYKINQLDESVINIDEKEKDQGNLIFSEVITKNHVKFFYSMFKGRKDVYSNRSYCAIYEKDLLESNKNITISSPGINEKKVKHIISLMQEKQESGISVVVITLKAECYPEKRVDKTKQLIRQLLEIGIIVKQMSDIHEHYAIVDEEIVWYGSMNLLSGEKEDDNLMRVVSKEIAQELMEITFGKVGL